MEQPATFTFHGVKAETECKKTDTKLEKLYETENFTRVPLDYGNRSICMEIIMPNEGIDISQALTLLKDGEWDMLFDESSETPLSGSNMVIMPMFSQNMFFEYKDILKRLGVNTIFDLADEGKFGLHKLRQKMDIKVSKEGTTVASVTLGEDKFSAVINGILCIDRPFLYFIREWSTGTILYAGAVTDI